MASNRTHTVNQIITYPLVRSTYPQGFTSRTLITDFTLIQSSTAKKQYKD